MVLLSKTHLHAQLAEKFDDGDFTNNPSWAGGTTDWIVNASQQLQSNNTVANSSFYLTTPNTLATTAEWNFYLALSFNTSSTNYVDVYLTASQADLTQASNSGFFIRFGGTKDEICLFRKGTGGTNDTARIIDGADGTLNTSDNKIKVRVTRDGSNQWILYRDLSGTGASYVSEGSVTDASILSSAFFGISVKQSTASFFQKHFLDDIEIKAYTPDITAPTIVSAVATSSTTVDVVFSEPVDNASAQNVNNYSVNNGIGVPASAVVSGGNPALVTLSFGNSFSSGVTNALTINGVKDLAGNPLSNGLVSFSYYVSARYDVVIDEIMADPTPEVGLPNAEWIELKNTSPVPVNLQNFKIGKPGGISGPLPSLILQPDSFLIVTTSSQVAALSAFGRTTSVTSFPSLSNDGDLLLLLDNNGATMHAVNYSSDWYQNPVKADGGWTLEMIDTHNPCSGISNWKASVDSKGGTPGHKNSIDAANPDVTEPVLLRAYAKDNLNISLYFDEPLDSLSAAVPASYLVSDGIGNAIIATSQGPLFSQVDIVLNTPLAADKVYTVTVSNVTNCSGNLIGSSNTARFGLASPADSLDIIVNEILFDPPSFGYDYLELYNRSNKIIDLASINIANRSSTSGAIGSITPIVSDHYLLNPGEFIAITEDPTTVQQQYIVKNPSALTRVATMPSFPDDKGWAIVLNNQGQIIDELAYSDNWHFPLVDNTQGVALERIDYNKTTNDATNWTSAASTAGFGTPTYQNSQYRADLMTQGEIEINPKMFSPDNDGYEDFTLIQFKFPEPGYTANITIYDAAGRPMRVLQRNTTCAATGSFRWDGLNDKQQKVPIGAYIIDTEIFNLQGKKKHFKNTVVVARKM